jgi:hypothetical protein
MKSLFKGIDAETELLISVGAAVAAGCIPCLERLVSKAKVVKLDLSKLKAAAIIGQFVKDQPASHMKEASDRLLGTHLGTASRTDSCPMEENDGSVTHSQGDGQRCSCQ